MRRSIVAISLSAFSVSMIALGLGFHDGISIMPSAQAQEYEEQDRNQFRCTADELRGNYGVLADGFFVQGPQPILGPFAAVGLLAIKANKTFSLNLTQNFNGTILRDQLTGRFILNNDCTGTLTISNDIAFEFVVVNKGREIQFMRTKDSPNTRTVITGVAKRQRINTTR